MPKLGHYSPHLIQLAVVIIAVEHFAIYLWPQEEPLALEVKPYLNLWTHSILVADGFPRLLYFLLSMVAATLLFAAGLPMSRFMEETVEGPLYPRVKWLKESGLYLVVSFLAQAVFPVQSNYEAAFFENREKLTQFSTVLNFIATLLFCSITVYHGYNSLVLMFYTKKLPCNYTTAKDLFNKRIVLVSLEAFFAFTFFYYHPVRPIGFNPYKEIPFYTQLDPNGPKVRAVRAVIDVDALNINMTVSSISFLVSFVLGITADFFLLALTSSCIVDIICLILPLLVQAFLVVFCIYINSYNADSKFIIASVFKDRLRRMKR